MQETPANKLLPALADKLKSGSNLRRLVTAPRWPTPALLAARTMSASTP